MTSKPFSLFFQGIQYLVHYLPLCPKPSQGFYQGTSTNTLMFAQTIQTLSFTISSVIMMYSFNLPQPYIGMTGHTLDFTTTLKCSIFITKNSGIPLFLCNLLLFHFFQCLLFPKLSFYPHHDLQSLHPSIFAQVIIPALLSLPLFPISILLFANSMILFPTFEFLVCSSLAKLQLWIIPALYPLHFY